jgi:hypothetical protein
MAVPPAPNAFVNRLGAKSQNTGAGSSSAHPGGCLSITTGGVNQTLTAADATTIVMNNAGGAVDLHLPTQVGGQGLTIYVQSRSNTTTVKKSVADGSGTVGAAAGVLTVGKMSIFACPNNVVGWIQIYLQP